MSNENKAYIVIIVLAAALSYCLWSGILHDNGAGDSAIREQLATIERNQHDITTRLDGITKDLAQSVRRVESIEERIDRAESGVAEVAGQLADSQIALTESARLIDENQRIISAIRQRAEKNTGPLKN